MELNYTFTKEDYINYNLYYAKTKRKKYRWLMTLSVPATFVILESPHLIKGEFNPKAWLYFGTVGILWALIYWFTYIPRTKLGLHRKLKTGSYNNIFGEYHWLLNDDEIKTSNEHVNSTYKIDSFISSEENEKYFFFFITANNALILPKRSLKSEEILFIKQNLINKYHGNTRPR